MYEKINFDKLNEIYKKYLKGKIYLKCKLKRDITNKTYLKQKIIYNNYNKKINNLIKEFTDERSKYKNKFKHFHEIYKEVQKE